MIIFNFLLFELIRGKQSLNELLIYTVQLAAVDFDVSRSFINLFYKLVAACLGNYTTSTVQSKVNSLFALPYFL